MEQSFIDAMGGIFQTVILCLAVFTLTVVGIGASLLYHYGRVLLKQIDEMLASAMNFRNMFNEPKE